MFSHARSIFRGYPEVLFLQGTAMGAVLFIITLIRPEVAVGGLLAVLSAYTFARLIGMHRHFVEGGFYTYNPLLTGLLLASLFKFSLLTELLVLAAGVFTFLITAVMANLSTRAVRVPILSMPFVIASSVIYLASLRYGHLLASMPSDMISLDWTKDLPNYITGFLRSFGTIVVMPSVLAGSLVALLVLLHSRILFMLAVLGYALGTAVRAWMLGSWAEAFSDVNGFNFILIAMAIGGVFLVPTLKSFLLASVGVILATFVLDASTVIWSSLGVPMFALSFNLICITLLYVLRLTGYPGLAIYMGRTPEETLEHATLNANRYRGQWRTLRLPFNGRWTVWQGFDGPWTHQGVWRYAYDFVITDARGKTHRGQGERLEDFYCFGKPVTSPIRGRVVKVVSNLPDMPAGQVDRTDNWGNLIIIHDARGFYVEMSHFAENSIRVEVGQWVEAGQVLGLCGSSGYSPQPHLHIQVQPSERMGDGTLPFSFTAYVSDESRYFANDVPSVGSRVEPTTIDRRMDVATTWLLDDVLAFEVQHRETNVGRLEATVRMAPDGTFYLSTSKGELYFSKHDGTFYFYRLRGEDPYLKLLFLAMPRVPLSCCPDLQWDDDLPLSLIAGGARRAMIRFARLIMPDLARVRSHLRFDEAGQVVSTIRSRSAKQPIQTCVTFDDQGNLLQVNAGDWQLQRMSGKAERGVLVNRHHHELPALGEVQNTAPKRMRRIPVQPNAASP